MSPYDPSRWKVRLNQVKKKEKKQRHLIIILISIVFQYKDDVVAVVSIKSNEHALSAVPLVVNAVLEHHSFLVDVVVIVQPNHFPRSRYGDKVRRKALSQYVERKL